LPNLSEITVDQRTDDWTPIMVAEWYATGKRIVEVVSGTAVW
jgi:hypothetical protein